MWKFVLVICVALFINVDAHVQLLYPPATLNLDFLDNFRTSGICGHETTGVELTEQWRLPEVDNTTVTSIQTGSNLTVNWALHYAHQGGWLFELYNADGELTSTWNSTDHWDCTSDSTQQEAILRMPDTPCEGCILRLRRQALEWGEGYRFHSCALVDIVDEAEDGCNGCSGNGRCVRGSCECFNSTQRGFWYGDHCEKQNECEVDEHCGEHGVCVDSGNITPPNKQCYCREGYFGSEGRPIRDSDIAVRTCTRESNLTLGDPTEWAEEYDFMFESPGRGLFQLFYTLDQENEEIEFAIRARTQNWVAIGFRPIATGSVNSQRSGQSTDDAESEGATEEEEEEEVDSEETTEEEDEVESEGRRRSLKHVKGMPQIQQERESVTIQKRALLQRRRRSRSGGVDDDGSSSEDVDDDGSSSEDVDDDGSSSEDVDDDGSSSEDVDDDGSSDDDDDSPAPITAGSGSSVDEETEAEGNRADHEHKIEDAVGEGDTSDEDGAAEGEGDDDTEFCEDGSPTITVYDEGLHDLATPPRGRGERGLKSFSMPLLQSEKHQSRTLKQDQDDNEDDESTAEGEEDEDHDHEDHDDHDHEDHDDHDHEDHDDHDHEDHDDHDHEDHEDHDHEDAEGEEETADEDSEGEGEENEESESEGAAEGDEEAAESEGAAEGDGHDEEDEEYIPELIAEGTECEAEAVDPGAHPMINQDIILAYAKDGIFRIQDSFTPSRAKPLPDSFFGGDDGIIDAIGSQTGQFTNIKFRRRLTSLDGFGDYCILPEVDYWLIYAFGQNPVRYSHDPPSGLETGRASNERFYGEDELKYHGGGIGTTYEGRGSFGSVNFFEEAPTERAPGEGCLESTMEDYECMMEALGGDFIIHWTVEDDGVAFACETSGTGWVGIGWPETPGVMIGSQAVIGLGGDEGSVSTYVLEAKAPTGITQDNALFEIEDGEIETNEETSVLRFKRLFDDEFDGEGEIDLVVAFHATSNEIEYHGTTRGGVTITLS